MTLSQRLSVQVSIALAAKAGCSGALDKLVAVAKSLGLTGVEIDAAASGRSFDVRDSAAVALGCAYCDGSRSEIERSQLKAREAGLTRREANAVRRLALEYVGRRSTATGSARKSTAKRKTGPTSAS